MESVTEIGRDVQVEVGTEIGRVVRVEEVTEIERVVGAGGGYRDRESCRDWRRLRR